MIDLKLSVRTSKVTALLSDPSMARAILPWLTQTETSDLPTEQVERLRVALRAHRLQASTRNARAFARAAVGLAEQLGAVDAGLGDRASAEVRRLVAREPCELDGRSIDVSRLATYGARVQQCDDAYKCDRNRFLCANLRLVVKVASRYANTWMPLCDRVQEGNLGLIKAA